jgi:hypothetical protein
MDPPSIPPDVARLLGVVIENVDRLEILLAMRREKDKSFTAKTLRAQLSLRGSDVDTHLAILCGRGFLWVTIGSDLVYAYRPMSKTIEDHVTEVAELWEKRRSEVLRLMRAHHEDNPARVFAEAVRLRKPGEGDE